jgi:hypothetical protein
LERFVIGKRLLIWYEGKEGEKLEGDRHR